MLAFNFVPILHRFGKFWERNQQNFTASRAEYIINQQDYEFSTETRRDIIGPELDF